jgi:hypothetical protein
MTTKRELARLVRVTRALGSWHEAPGVRSFACPIHYEAKLRAGDREGLSHRFTVYGAADRDPTSVAAVTAALASHLADAADNGEPCDASFA